MFFEYARELLRAEDGLSESEKIRLAEQIEKWALWHEVRNIGHVHRVLDEWIDDRLKRKSRVLVTLKNQLKNIPE